MKVTILDFIPNAKNKRIGYVDFKVTFTDEKFEIFRNCGYFQNENRKWVSLPMVERHGKWVSTYERSIPLKDIFIQAVKALEEYLATNTVVIPQLPQQEVLF